MPAPGSSTFGPYEIIGPLGTGGMGEVYRARDPRLQRNVALKILHETNGHDPLRQTRLLHEARAASALNHPNILVVYDVGIERDVPYVVSELIDGTSLREVLSRGALPVKELLDVAVQIADGLAAAHEAGLVHRDLKPENVMVTPDRRVKILDFGVAKMTFSSAASSDTTGETVLQQAKTASGLIQGTVPYMSPEQARGGGVDFRSDQFSFGLLLYEMATGTRAFSRDTPVQTLTAIIEDEPRPLGEANSKTPLLLRWIVDRCLAKDPRQRYAATTDLAHDLRTLRDRLKETTTNSGAIESVVPPRRRWSVVAAIVGALAVAILAAALVRPPLPAVPRFTSLASDSGYQGMPAWSADGKTIAYVADVDGVRQVFTRSISASQRAQITHSLFDCRDPFWARDGSRIFYISNAAEGYGVWSVGAAGGPAESVIRNADSAALSPDGRTLAILRSDERDTYLQLWLSSPPEAEPKRYVREPFATQKFSDAFMRFAPDSSKLAVWARTWQSGVPGPNLFIVPVGDTPSHLVAEVPDVLSTNNPPRFDWLADNRRIVAGVERTAVQGVHLWVVDTQSGDMRPLTSGAGGENTPAVSPDGRRIAYATQDTNFDLIEVPLDGSSPRQLLATSRNESEPGWSPVSAQYAFVTDRNGRPEIWLRSRDGAWERPLVTDESFAHEVTHTFRLPVFSPDGQRIAFERVTSSGAVLWIATLAGGPPVQATKGEPGLFISNYSPTWSPDGEWIAFVDVRPGKWSLAKVRVGTGSRPQILHDVTGLAHPQWSPDNRWIACMTDQGLTLIAPDGKSARVLREGEIWTVYGWSTDASTLYGVTQSDDSRRLILVAVDVASGRERVINDNLAPMPPVNAPIKGFSRISDKSFATSLVHVRSDLWLIDDFVPPPSLIDRFWSRNLLTTWRTQNNPRSP